MTNIKMLAAATLLTSVIASPVMARDMNNRATSQQTYDSNAYDRADSGFWPADAASGIVGGAVGAAGAIATAPFRDDAYAYKDGTDNYGPYSQSYAQRNGFVCQPGTWFRGEDGRPHICQ